MDKNTRISERALSLIFKINSSSEIVFRLSNEKLGAIVNTLHKEFSVHEMLNPPANDVFGLDRALSFLFYHGVVTLSEPINGSPIKVKLPNKIAKIDFLDKLKQQLSLPERLLCNVANDPSEKTVHALLQKIIVEQVSLFDNFLSEGGLQHMIEAALRAQLRGNTSVQAEVEMGAGRSDMIIKFPGSHIVLEFKRIRLNACLLLHSQKMVTQSIQSMLTGTRLFNIKLLSI